MRRWSARSLSAVAALSLFALGACDEALAPEGKSAAVDVRIYLDRDASGTFTAADSGLPNVALTLSSTDGAGLTAQATSDAQGVATFPEVTPGAYSLTLPATAPAGTVLSTSVTPRVVVSAIGQVQVTEIRYSWIPGTITGRIFRDDDGSGDFSQGDTPGAGLYAVLSQGGITRDSVIADNEGRYSFRFLTPGTYTLRLENPGSITYANGATRTVNVTAGATNSLSAVFTGALVIPVAEARTRSIGSTVAVVGVVTVRPGRFTSGSGGVNSEIFVQDATGGISVFTVPTADSATLAVGDTVEVSGALGAFNQQLQIVTPRVTRRSGGPVPAPTLQSAAQAASLARDGQLIRVSNLTVLSVQTGTNPAFTVFTEDASGTALQVRVSGANTGLTRADFAVGSRYNVTGVLSRFNATAQIRIRDVADLELGATITPIATVRTSGTNGTIYTIAGRITVPPAAMPTSGTNTTNSELWVQDASGGIAVFSVPTADTTVYQVGNTVEVTGVRGAFSQQLQLTSPTVVRTGAGSPVAPVVQTIDQALAFEREAQLITVNDFVVTSVQTGTSAAFNVNGTVDGKALVVRVAGALRGISRASFTVGSSYDVTGILTRFNTTAQLKVRFASDITP